MAFTFSDFKKGLRDYFGAYQTNVSGDGGGDVVDHTARVVSKVVGTEFPATATITVAASVTPKVLFIAEEECDIRSIRVSAAGSLTVSATDYVLLTVIKRKSTSFSVTEQVGLIAIGQTSTWTLKTGFSRNPTIATTASVLDMDPGDTLTGALSRNGAAVALQSPLLVQINYEEK